MSVNQSVFVAMPFDPESDDRFKFVIEKTIKEFGCDCVRMDRKPFTGSIIAKIQEEIAKASLLIADLSKSSPNVFLEIGYAWGIKCPTILLAPHNEDLPFNIRDQKILKYNSMESLNEQLNLAIDEIIRKPREENSIELYFGDITKIKVDAIVNAANSELSPGQGVSGTIHKKAGSALAKACSTIPEVQPDLRCPVGQSRLTDSYQLPCRFVIHTVGPLYTDGDNDEPALLEESYSSALDLAQQFGIQTIAFPAISTGVYRYPKKEAAQIAVKVVSEWIRLKILPKRVVFCCFTKEDMEIYKEALRAIGISFNEENNHDIET